MNRIRRVGRTWARGSTPPATREPHSRQLHGSEPHLVSRPGSDGFAARFIQDLAAGPSVVPGQNRPAPMTTNSRRRTMTMPRPLTHTIQVCVHCRHNPAGFWVSRNVGQTVRRPWCLSCCHDQDPACYHVQPFDP